MKLKCTLLFLCLLLMQSFAQSVSTFKTAIPKEGTARDLRHLVESLVGQGIILKNYSVTRASAYDAFGFFQDQSAVLGMKKGLLMTTGGISNLPAANTTFAYSCKNSNYSQDTKDRIGAENTYPELSRLLKDDPLNYDACVIELDIVPTSDTLSFNYVFGSEEYDEYVGSDFNDAFAFFISGKGIKGEKNLAVVPGTEVPVSVNTINGGQDEMSAATATNPTYYVRNTAGQIAIEYDGLTRLMEIRQPVIPYETYHLKMAIADVGDDALDSGVFIEGQSFISYDKSYNVLFDHSSSKVEEGYKTMLRNIAALSKKDSRQGTILITGHTDSDGSQAYNDKLSQDRATEVYAYLQSQGVREQDMLLISKGENMPRSSNYEEAGKHLNRRVEVKICGSTEAYQAQKNAELRELSNAPNAIKDNYPNPFNSSTSIRLFLKEDVKNAAVIITDIKGTVIKTIYVLERGNTEIYTDSENFTNGIYVASLVVDGALVGSIKLLVEK